MVKVKTYPIQLNENINGEIEEETRKNNVVKFIQQGKGMCFNYALKIEDLYCIEASFEILETTHKQISLQKVKKGDIITIHYDTDEIAIYTCQHFAIIKKVNDNIDDIIIRSKWGNWGVYEGKLKDLPPFYGNAVIFWGKK